MTASEWKEIIFRPAVLGLMVGCLALAGVTLAGMAAPSWDGTYLVPFFVLTAIEAYFSQRASSRASSPLRLVEIGLLFLALQVWMGIATGQAVLQDGLPQIDPLTVGLFVPVLLCWRLVRDTASYLDRIGEAPEHDPRYVPPRQRLVNRYFAGGVLLVAAALPTQEHVARLLKISDPSAPRPLLHVLAYFLLGALLLGEVRYAALHRRWEDHDGTVQARLGRSWAWYSIALVGLMAAGAMLIAFGPVLGLVDLGRAAWDPLMTVVLHTLTLSKHVLTRLLSLVRLPTHILHVNHPPRGIRLPPNVNVPISPNAIPGHPHHAAHHHAGGGSTSRWLGWVETFLFWGGMAAGLLLLARAYLRRGLPGSRLTLSRLWAVLSLVRHLLAALRETARRIGRQTAQRVRVGGQSGNRDAPSGASLLRAIRKASRSPREQVIHYYFNTVRQAERSGFRRRQSQTPREFDSMLAPRLREARADMRQLTGAFEEARYSRHEVEAERIEPVRQNWRRVRVALRRAGGLGDDTSA